MAANAFFTTDKGAKLKETVSANPVKAPAVVTGLTSDQKKQIQVSIIEVRLCRDNIV